MHPPPALDRPLSISLLEGEVVFLGQGTANFSMTLEAARATLDRLVAVLHSPPVVLVVEDEPVVRAVGVAILEAAGYGVIEAESAAEALGALEAGAQVHLVFTDIQMPGEFDGLELAHRVRRRWPAIHLLIVSGRAIEERALPDQGRFLPKPYVAADVLRHVGELTAA